MKVSDIVKDKIGRLESGFVFTYDYFQVGVYQISALKKALSRLVASGMLRKLSKGRFYKPQMSEFGELKPDIYQVVKDLLEKDSKISGYLTGYSIYSQLGLTTQVPNIIQIGVNREKKALTRGVYQIKFIKQSNKITKENITLLRILDSIRYIKEIPDTTVDKACSQLMLIIKELEKVELDLIKKLVVNYTPATRALTGAIIENTYTDNEAESIYKTLNPASKYNFSVKEETLSNKQKWYIK